MVLCTIPAVRGLHRLSLSTLFYLSCVFLAQDMDFSAWYGFCLKMISVYWTELNWTGCLTGTLYCPLSYWLRLIPVAVFSVHFSECVCVRVCVSKKKSRAQGQWVYLAWSACLKLQWKRLITAEDKHIQSGMFWVFSPFRYLSDMYICIYIYSYIYIYICLDTLGII